MELFKIRASACGDLMTPPKLKTAELSKTAETYIQNWCKGQIYGIQKHFTSKYTDKGLAMEDEAIDKAIEWLKLDFALKNENKYENDFMVGTPDIIIGDTVYDIKNSWDFTTFPLFENEIPTKGYYYQLQVYMCLTGLKKAKLVYMLLDTPETFSNPAISYENVDKKYRIKTYDVEYSEDVIKEIETKVLQARKYINNLIY